MIRLYLLGRAAVQGLHDARCSSQVRLAGNCKLLLPARCSLVGGNKSSSGSRARGRKRCGRNYFFDYHRASDPTRALLQHLHCCCSMPAPCTLPGDNMDTRRAHRHVSLPVQPTERRCTVDAPASQVCGRPSGRFRLSRRFRPRWRCVPEALQCGVAAAAMANVANRSTRVGARLSVPGGGSGCREAIARTGRARTSNGRALTSAAQNVNL